jgi:uncharacterized coiled-coil protein SlyX
MGCMMAAQEFYLTNKNDAPALTESQTLIQKLESLLEFITRILKKLNQF